MVDQPKPSPSKSYKEWQDIHSANVTHNISEEIRRPQSMSVGSRWQMYRRHAIDYLYQDYANIFELSSLLNRIGERTKDGKPVTVLDASGAADARSIGATHTINVVLQKNAEMEKLKGPHRTFVPGDICKGETQDAVFRTIDAVDPEGADVIFFQPGSAFSLEDENPYVNRRLFGFFSLLLTKLKVGGELLSRLDAPHNRKWFKPLVQALDSTMGEKFASRHAGHIQLANGMRFSFEFVFGSSLSELQGTSTWDALPSGSRMSIRLRRVE